MKSHMRLLLFVLFSDLDFMMTFRFSWSGHWTGHWALRQHCEGIVHFAFGHFTVFTERSVLRMCLKVQVYARKFD